MDNFSVNIVGNSLAPERTW